MFRKTNKLNKTELEGMAAIQVYIIPYTEAKVNPLPKDTATICQAGI
jgi:hypothetical protein